MALGKIIPTEIIPKTGETTGEFSIDFSQSCLGPYSHILQRKNLYFNENSQVRGSYFFPLKDSTFQNTEIFLETNDIVIGVGTRGSFSGEEKQFVEVISLKRKETFRFYPDEVQCIYNTQDEVIVYYKDSGKYSKLILEQKTLKKISETEIELHAFFKLLYNQSEKSYYRLYFHPHSSTHTKGYFEEQKIHCENQEIPIVFQSQKFILEVQKVDKNYIDVWESSLTGKLAYIHSKNLG